MSEPTYVDLSGKVEPYDPTPEELAEWEQWLNERPTRVAEVARRLLPWKLFRMKSTGQRVLVMQYDEEVDGSCTVTVLVHHYLNPCGVPRSVFGVDPDDLEPCDDWRSWLETDDF